jgi:hypothetical protein
MPKGSFKLCAWLTRAEPRNMENLRKHASKLNRIFPVWYRLGDEGLAMRSLAFSEAQRSEIRAVGVEIWGALRADDEAQVFRMVSDGHCADFHAQGLIRLAQEDGAKGLLLRYGDLRASAQGALGEFLTRLQGSCRSAGLKLGVVDPPPGFRLDLDAVLSPAMDYSGARPLAGISWISQRLAEAKAVAGPEVAIFGFPGLGLDPNGKILDFAAWEELLSKHGPAQRDAESAELVLDLGHGREAWYCDSIATLRKLWIARQAGLSQGVLWSLGTEDPRLWDMLEDFPVPFAL